MAVLLVAIFPIVLIFNSQMAWLGVSVGILLLYLDRRRELQAQTTRRPAARKRVRPSARSKPHSIGFPSRA